MNFIKNLKRYKEVIVVVDYTFSGGGARPIYTYYRNKLNKGDTDVLFLRLALRNSFIKLFLLLLFKNRFIINGEAPFWYWPVHLVCFLKKNIIIYLHEAGPHLEGLKRSKPLKYSMLRRWIRQHKVAFVSEWQENYFKEHFEVGRSKVIYNAMPLPTVHTGDFINIVMVAFQTKNKNVDFFSEVADLAAQQGKKYKFHWIGGDGGEMQGQYHSKNVRWWGDQDQVMDLLNHFDLLLFTSRSDTFGLVLMEALYKGKRIVTYKENGLAAYLKEMPGCRIFDTFDAPLVLEQIAAALGEEVNMGANKILANDLCSVAKLEERLDLLFNEQ